MAETTRFCLSYIDSSGSIRFPDLVPREAARLDEAAFLRLAVAVNRECQRIFDEKGKDDAKVSMP